MAGVYNYQDQAILASLYIFERDDDAFFNPVRLGHTGFAYDGYMYTNGEKDPDSAASWFGEGPSNTRGDLQTFPTEAIVLLGDASLTILDATTSSLNMWLIFILTDNYGLPNNITTQPHSYTARALTWGDGVLSVLLEPDAGSTSQAAMVVSFDFSQDTIYADTSV